MIGGESYGIGVSVELVVAQVRDVAWESKREGKWCWGWMRGFFAAAGAHGCEAGRLDLDLLPVCGHHRGRLRGAARLRIRAEKSACERAESTPLPDTDETP